jgi:hypothetical protein
MSGFAVHPEPDPQNPTPEISMRKLVSFAVLFGAATLAVGQQPPPIPDRYGVAASPEAYPQGTPKETLASTVRALEKGRIEYVAAHLLDPVFVDAKVSERAKTLEESVDRELRVLREKQRGSPPGVDRVPLDPAGLAARVQAEAKQRAFRLVTQDMRSLLAENPDHLRDLQRFLRAGEIAESGDTAKATLRDVKDRSVFFRRDGLRWFVLDQKQEPGPAAPAK